jgi:hypothetical protein
MAKRKRTDIVQSHVRLREALRQRLERQAQRNGVSLNSEMAARLERSLDVEDRLADMLGGEQNLQLFRVMGPAIAKIEAEAGKRWEADVATWVRVSRTIAAIMHGFQHIDHDPSKLTAADALNELIAGRGSTIAGAAAAGPLVKRALMGDDAEEDAPPTLD